MPLDGTVKVPFFGTLKKKTAVYGGVGLVAAGAGIWWWRQRQAGQAAAAASGAQAATGSTGAAAGAVTDPAGNTCAAVNPATGYCPGTAEDQQALAGALGAYDTSGLGNSGLEGYYYGTDGSTPSSAPGPGNFADNAEWAQYAEQYITQDLGGDPASTGNALGKYITGQPVNSSMQNIIQEAIAYAGNPPVPGANGDPPGIDLQAAPPASAKVKVPYVTGLDLTDAQRDIGSAGLKSTASGPKTTKAGQTRMVTRQSPAASTLVAKGSNVALTYVIKG